MAPKCIFCLKTFSANSRAAKGGSSEVNETRFLQLLQRYLNANLGPFPSRPGPNSRFQLCNDCRNIVNSFCDAYSDMRRLELEVEWKIRKLKDVVVFANRVPSRIAAFRKYYSKCGELDEIAAINEFRRRLAKHCRQKLAGGFPRVVVTRQKNGLQKINNCKMATGHIEGQCINTKDYVSPLTAPSPPRRKVGRPRKMPILEVEQPWGMTNSSPTGTGVDSVTCLSTSRPGPHSKKRSITVKTEFIPPPPPHSTTVRHDFNLTKTIKLEPAVHPNPFVQKKRKHFPAVTKNVIQPGFCRLAPPSLDLHPNPFYIPKRKVGRPKKKKKLVVKEEDTKLFAIIPANDIPIINSEAGDVNPQDTFVNEHPGSSSERMRKLKCSSNTNNGEPESAVEYKFNPLNGNNLTSTNTPGASDNEHKLLKNPQVKRKVGRPRKIPIEDNTPASSSKNIFVPPKMLQTQTNIRNSMRKCFIKVENTNLKNQRLTTAAAEAYTDKSSDSTRHLEVMQTFPGPGTFPKRKRGRPRKTIKIKKEKTDQHQQRFVDESHNESRGALSVPHLKNPFNSTIALCINEVFSETTQNGGIPNSNSSVNSNSIDTNSFPPPLPKRKVGRPRKDSVKLEYPINPQFQKWWTAKNAKRNIKRPQRWTYMTNKLEKVKRKVGRPRKVPIDVERHVDSNVSGASVPGASATDVKVSATNILSKLVGLYGSQNVRRRRGRPKKINSAMMPQQHRRKYKRKVGRPKKPPAGASRRPFFHFHDSAVADTSTSHSQLVGSGQGIVFETHGVNTNTNTAWMEPTTVTGRERWNDIRMEQTAGGHVTSFQSGNLHMNIDISPDFVVKQEVVSDEESEIGFDFQNELSTTDYQVEGLGQSPQDDNNENHDTSTDKIQVISYSPLPDYSDNNDSDRAPVEPVPSVSLTETQISDRQVLNDYIEIPDVMDDNEISEDNRLEIGDGQNEETQIQTLAISVEDHQTTIIESESEHGSECNDQSDVTHISTSSRTPSLSATTTHDNITSPQMNANQGGHETNMSLVEPDSEEACKTNEQHVETLAQTNVTVLPNCLDSNNSDICNTKTTDPKCDRRGCPLPVHNNSQNDTIGGDELITHAAIRPNRVPPLSPPAIPEICSSICGNSKDGMTRESSPSISIHMNVPHFPRAKTAETQLIVSRDQNES